MKREFTESDRTKKKARLALKSASATSGVRSAPAGLEEAVKAALDNGFLPCATAFGIAKKFKVPLVTMGDAADRLGARITNCQLGCFKVDKTLHDNMNKEAINQRALEAMETSLAEAPLTCLGVFRLAKRIGVRPVEVADAANWRHVKIHDCQLGCW